MSANFISKNPVRIFAWTFFAFILLLMILEGWRYAVKPSPQNKDQVVAQELEETAVQFIESQQELLSQSRALASTLQSQIERESARSVLFESLESYSNFWGAGLYRRNQPIVWNNFSRDPFQQIQDSDKVRSFVEVQKQNNVIYWLCRVGFEIQTEDGTVPYHLYTAKRIEQTNALPFATELEYSILEERGDNDLYSVNLGIYSPLPASYIDYRVLTTLAKDSVGTVYATSGNIDEAVKKWYDANQFWRALFALLCFVVISMLFYYRVDVLSNWKSLVIQLFIIAIGWLVFDYISIAEYWIPILFEEVRPTVLESYQSLINFFIDALFFLFASFTLHNNSKRQAFQLHSTWFLSSITAAFVAGLINTAGIIFIFQECYELAKTTSIPLLTLQVYPGIAAILFYIAFGIMLLALSMVLMAVNRFLFRSCRDQSKLVAAICSSSCVLSLFIILLTGIVPLAGNWSFIIGIIYFAFIFFLSYVFFNVPQIMRQSSPLRNAAIGSLIISIAGSTLIYYGQMSSKDRDLSEIKKTYSRNKDEQAEQIITDVLNRLEQEFNSITEQDLQERTAFLQAQFTETIESALNKTGPLYSFNLQLIKPNSELIADYSTELNSPDWVNVFNIRRLRAVIDIQQIGKNNVRPIVQQPELEDAEKYQTFSRGWIPIFGSTEKEPIAWILCSVYQERPNFNKPMRAVMSSVRYQDWSNSFAIQQYTDRQLKEVTYQGIKTNYPIYNRLQPAEVDALEQDSMVYYTSMDDLISYRNLLVGQPAGQVAKISMVLPGYQNILFSFFRLSFTLLVTGFFLLMIYRWLKTGHIVFFGKDVQFQYRILDSFLLATLVFLVMLVFATHYAIKKQNRDLVEQQLLEKLESIANATENNAVIRRKLEQGAAFSMDALTAPLNVDASFYLNGVIKESTTPQIYQQHLLPSTIPYPVYGDLFQSQKRNALTSVMLNQQDLLIGYRSVLSDEGEPIAAIAIPTFVQSPKYDRQLLETTSYLIILYLVVFGLFILGTTIISRQLTRPLHYIRQGLNKISKGDLDTTIPVTSKDEIGSLAIAYNQMVARLKELQKELAAAEREAAWQEMAQQVAHEIKNPLTPMKLNIQHLERQLAFGDYTIDELKEKIQTTTQNLIVQIKSLNNIASDFSKFSKPIEEDFAVVDIHDLVHSVSDLYKHDLQTTIITRCNATPSIVYGAQDELRRVIINLVKNAHEAMPDGGTINLLTFLRNGSLFIKVEDDGEGITEMDKSKIFVPNFSTKSSGTGLGLAICKKVIEAHNGSISFASIKGEGSTFVIKLPVYRS